MPLTDKINALLPATKGVAIDVPLSTAKLPRGTGKVERIFPPGAETAGLKNISNVGPKELNEDMRPPAGSGKLNAPPV